MSTSFGSRRLVVGAHYGLRDWLAQRITSLLMALFTIVVVAQVLFGGRSTTTAGRRSSRRNG